MNGPPSAVLHGVRILGFAAGAEVAARTGLDVETTTEELLDHQARGHVTWSEFAGAGGWSLSEAGRRENERLLGVELDAVPEGRTRLTATYDAFLPVNERLQQACTEWQLRPTASDRLAVNDHADPVWDERILTELRTIADELALFEAALVAVLPRFGGYHARFAAAVAAHRIDDRAASCHQVWFELHEDLIATLGGARG